MCYKIRFICFLFVSLLEYQPQGGKDFWVFCSLLLHYRAYIQKNLWSEGIWSQMWGVASATFKKELIKEWPQRVVTAEGPGTPGHEDQAAVKKRPCGLAVESLLCHFQVLQLEHVT